MPTYRPCQWNGTPFDSVAEAALANNVSYNTMAYRIRMGYQSDSDLKTKQPVIFKGKLYANRRAAAEQAFYSYDTVKRYIRKNRNAA